MDYLVPKNIALTILVYIIASMFMGSYDPKEWNLFVDLIAACSVWNIWTDDE